MLVITQSVIRKMPHLPSIAPYNHDLITDAIAMYAQKKNNHRKHTIFRESKRSDSSTCCYADDTSSCASLKTLFTFIRFCRQLLINVYPYHFMNRFIKGTHWKIRFYLPYFLLKKKINHKNKGTPPSHLRQCLMLPAPFISLVNLIWSEVK